MQLTFILNLNENDLLAILSKLCACVAHAIYIYEEKSGNQLWEGEVTVATTKSSEEMNGYYQRSQSDEGLWCQEEKYGIFVDEWLLLKALESY